MPEIRVRSAEPSDAEAVHEIFQCPRVVANTLQVPFGSLEATRSRLQPDPHRYRLAAEIDGRVVGMLGLHLVSNPRRSDCAAIGMAVHDKFQGQGVGSALMRAMLDLADGWLGLRRIELEVYCDNTPAVHLYEKFDFHVEGTLREYARRAGELVDAYYMARLRS